MRMLFPILTLVLSAAAGSSPVMPVGMILEQTFEDDDQAVVLPDRMEIICESGASSPWGFSFAGFETTWRGPIELEVIGSGGYTEHDVFSFAGITLDYGSKDGWTERSFIGLGLIQSTRSPHPPSWGVGSGGRFIMRENLLSAGPEAQRLTIDPAKYAPKDWDRRLWIGLCMHNVGASKSLQARILNASSDAEPSPQDRMEIIRQHQHAYLLWRAERLKESNRQTKSIRIAPLAAEIKPYAESIKRLSPHTLALSNAAKALADAEKGKLDAQHFLQIVGGNADPTVMQLAAAHSKADEINRLNACYNSWKKAGCFGKEIGCIIRTASNLEKIGLTDMTAGRLLTPDEPIRISAAKHEYEGCQIILTALEGCTSNVRVAVSELKGDKGRIPKSEITINPVGYVRIFEGQAGERLVPDPLLAGAIPSLKPGENQSVWITIRVPDITPAGEYKGFVRIYGKDPKPLSVPLVVKVRDFAIPHEISLRSSFWMFRDQINRFYGLDEVNLDDYFSWIDMALEHRLCPIDVVEGKSKMLVDTLNPNPDFTVWDRYLDRMVAGGASTIHLGLSHHHGAWFADEKNKISSPGQVERVIESLKVLRDHYQKKGIFDLHYLQLRDETSAPESLNVYREVKKALPDVDLLLTAPSAEARPLLDIPCPLTPGYDAGWQDEVRRKGGEYWWYVCCGPEDPWANLFLHQTPAQHRALFWQTWRYDVEGILYWGMNFWRWYGGDWPKGTKGPNWRVPPVSAPNFCPLPSAPGDGFSMYPGPTPDKPLSSIRLENMRDGEEDYEYFLILDGIIADAEGNGKYPAALRNARAVREEAWKLAEDMTGYPKTAAPYLEMREKVGDAIESLIR